MRPLTQPRAEWVPAWDELYGYVKQAADDGTLIRPEDLLDYMAELRQRAMAPVVEWLRKQGTGSASEPFK
jgi:hypothetical protein